MVTERRDIQVKDRETVAKNLQYPAKPCLLPSLCIAEAHTLSETPLPAT